MARKILVVDDSPTELRLMLAPLKGLGYEVSTASDGDEALAKSETNPPDLIILDVVMPKKNGYQVCRQLKTAPGTKHIKILMVSSKGEETDRYWGLKQGADGYVTKPFSDDHFLAEIRQLV